MAFVVFDMPKDILYADHKTRAFIRLIRNFKVFPYHVPGIVLFFLAHGYREYPGLIPVLDLILYFFITSGIGFLFLLLFFKAFNSWNKAGLFTFMLLTVYLFFGAFVDKLKPPGPLTFLSKYSILLPAIFVMLLLAFLLLKFLRRDFKKLTLYLNTVLSIFLLVDLVAIFVTSSPEIPNSAVAVGGVTDCKECVKPEIYFIVLDEYSGSTTLKNYFNYDNATFENFLESKGFFVAADPMSNYMSTSLSMASTFDMQYLTWMEKGKKIVVEDYSKAEETINKSLFFQYLSSYNYDIKNYSIFKIADQPSRFNTGLMATELQLITAKTLFNRMNKDLVWHLHGKAAPQMNWLAKKFQDDFKHGNQRLLNLTTGSLKLPVTRPRFIYTHLLMPHFPCIYDSLGQETNINFYDPSLTKKKLDDAYLQYLVYTNNIVKKLVDNIQTSTAKKAAIIVMSDHGYRGIDKTSSNISSNNNFFSVYLPSQNYSQFYDSITNVNSLRVFLNSLFNQHLYLAKDSIVN